ncbi:MAG: hypothetical protein JNL48_18815 [Acidobacteria bacterium]|nr:hypothetical protein [Acidobacteriota bacterium]
MSWVGIVAAAAALVAAAGWVVARRAARQVRDVTAMYWQLKFEHGELKARLDRALPDPSAPPKTPPGTQFVPLTSVKR